MNNIIFKILPYRLSIILFIIFLIAILKKSLVLLITGIIFKIFLLYFYRLPRIKNINIDKKSITSPAYGTIDNIIYTNDKVIISIILNLFDIHSQYIPYDGKIISQEYIPGKFTFMLFSEKKYDQKRVKGLWGSVIRSPLDSKENERNKIILKTKMGLIEIIQYAGYFTRRISSFVKDGDIKKRGDLYGFISFGSRVDIIMPKNRVELNVKLGQKLEGPMTIIGKWEIY